jgi:hypothetical protein
MRKASRPGVTISTDHDVVEGTKPGYYVQQRMAGSSADHYPNAWVRSDRYVVASSLLIALADASQLAQITGIDYRVIDEIGQIWGEVAGSGANVKRRGVDYH